MCYKPLARCSGYARTYIVLTVLTKSMPRARLGSMKYTTSFHNGNEVCLAHNRRTVLRKNIDKNGLYEVWRDDKLSDAYKQLFGEALKEYNAKQTRTDRKIRSYLQHIKNDKQKAPVYECIFQVGNEQIKPDFKTSRKILKDFADGFEQRNPNFKVVGIYFHADELGSAGKGGTPHVHLDYVPFGIGFKKGLKVQNSVKKALENMGYFDKLAGKKIIETGQTQWCNSERSALADICRQYGIEIENPKRPPAEYESSKMMRKTRDKSLELAKREAVIKDKEQEADMKLNIAQFVLNKAEQNHNAKAIILDLQNKMISQEKELRGFRHKDTALRQLAEEDKNVTLSNAFSAYDAEMQQSKPQTRSKQASIER